MLKKVDHIGIAVKDIESALKVYRDALGLKHEGTELEESRQLQAAMLDCGGTHVELLQATAPDSIISRFIEKRGEGIHHVCFEVDDIYQTLAALKAAGLRLVDEEPRKGVGGTLVAFIHPRSTGGVLLEVAQKTEKQPSTGSG